MIGKISGVFYGIVINDIDPDEKGRVQVYIPSLDYSLSSDSDTNFVFLGSKNGSITKEKLELLRSSSSWCSVLQPIFGGSSMGYYDYDSDTTTTSDSAVTTDGYDQNGKGVGNFGSLFSKFGSLSDAYADPTSKYVRKCNRASLDYFPKNHINSPKGVFNTPAIGAKVLIGFLGGERNNPIVLGKIPNEREIKIINA